MITCLVLAVASSPQSPRVGPASESPSLSESLAVQAQWEEAVRFCAVDCGDVDGDGRNDFALGDPGIALTERGFVVEGPGTVSLISGQTGTRIRRLVGELDSGLFGSAALSVADANDDGIGDLWVGAPFGFALPGPSTGAEPRVGGALLISAKDGTVMRRLTWGSWCADAGSLLLPIDDLDGDGIDDLCVGSSTGTQLFAASSSTGSILWTRRIEGGHFGKNVCALRDIDGDGVRELAVATRRCASRNGAYHGSLECVSGRTGETLAARAGHLFLPLSVGILGPLASDAGSEHSTVFVAAGDADSEPELLYRVRLPDFVVEAQFPPAPTDPGASAQQVLPLGSATTPIGDVDGDGLSDVAVTIPFRHVDAGQCSAGLRLLSGDLRRELAFVCSPFASSDSLEFGAMVLNSRSASTDGFSSLAILSWPQRDFPRVAPGSLQLFAISSQTPIWTYLALPGGTGSRK